MRKFPLISITFLGLALTFGMAACDGDDGDTGTENSSGDGDTTGDGDGDTAGDGDGEPTTSGDGDGDGGCWPVPEQCLRFVECIQSIVPAQGDAVESQYGAEGSCWCGSEDEALTCYNTCLSELEKAEESHPTAQACHGAFCPLEELDETKPYGPVVDGVCPDWDPGQGTTYPQAPLNNVAGLPGSVCSPPCTGVANTCAEHPQTAAAGTCLTIGGEGRCLLRCWVDHEAIGGTQCQCGATCQPQGGPDPEGNLRGFCTFE